MSGQKTHGYLGIGVNIRFQLENPLVNSQHFLAPSSGKPAHNQLIIAMGTVNLQHRLSQMLQI
jgi:hypothetical protein